MPQTEHARRVRVFNVSIAFACGTFTKPLGMLAVGLALCKYVSTPGFHDLGFLVSRRAIVTRRMVTAEGIPTCVLCSFVGMWIRAA